MLVLALDTATPVVTVGVVELTADAVLPRAVRRAHDARKHAELLMPAALEVCAEAGVALRDVEAVVVGVGPGPFTGLRVGMVTAAALGDALGVPVHGVCTHDAVAAEVATPAGPFLVVTDARRREVYWAAYAADRTRTDGPHVAAAATVPTDGVVAAAGGQAAQLDVPAVGPESPSPVGLVRVAADALRTGTAPAPLEPLYLRRPDAVEPAARKRVSAG